MLNQKSATLILAKYKNVLNAFVMHLKYQLDNTLADYVATIINNLTSISRGDLSKVKDVMSSIKSQKFLDLINNTCHEKSFLKKYLSFFLHEPAFTHQILLYRSNTNLFSVKFPDEHIRNNYIKNINSNSIKTFNNLNRDTFFIEFDKKNAKRVYFKTQQFRKNFIEKLNLNPTLAIPIGSNFLEINNDNILDKSKNISINLPEDEKACADFNKKITRQTSASFSIVDRHKNGFFFKLPVEIKNQIVCLIENREEKTVKSYKA